MHRFIEYAVFFIILILSQVFLFDSINLSAYLHPLVYIAFIILLPMEMPAVWVLMLGLLTGATMDFFSGDGGLNTIATLATAFFRQLALGLFVGKESVKEGGAPLPSRIGMGKFLRYSASLVLLQCALYFGFAVMTWDYFYLTALRIVSSAAVTMILMFLIQMLMPGNQQK